jgi:DNA-binding CsgD family transcriptional regulator
LALSGPDLIGQAVNLGIPPIRNYSRKVYGGGTQTWDAAQDGRNLMYFANNDGVLRYDGTSWTVLPVANNTIVRSVALAPDGRIYAGAQNEIGFFAPDARGQLSYTSLVGDLPPGERNFEDVWEILMDGETALFRTNRAIFRFSGTQVTVCKRKDEVHALFMSADGPMAQVGTDSLFRIQGDKLVPFARLDGVNSPITGAISWSADTLLLPTLKDGIRFLVKGRIGRWQTPYDAMLSAKRIYTAALLSDGSLALGTSLDGLYVLDNGRRLQQHLTNRDGLQNNTILCVFADRAGNAWLGLNNGIDCVNMQSRFTAVRPDGDLRGTGYAAAIQDGRLYLGVSNGAYATRWRSYFDPGDGPVFAPVTGADGQVWGLADAGGVLWVGQHEGARTVDDGKALPASPDGGYWTFIPLTSEFLLAGTYQGLVLFRKNKNTWQYDGRLRGLSESCRIMVRDAEGTIWVSHPYRGVYRIRWAETDRFDPEIRFYDQSAGLPSNLNNYVFVIAGQVFIGSEKGVFVYDATEERFRPDPEFNALLGESRRVKYLREDERGDIWYVAGNEVGRLRANAVGLRQSIHKEVFPELSGKLVGGFEFIYPVDAANVLFGTEEGFIHYTDRPASAADSQLHLLITEVRTQGKVDSVLYGGYEGEFPVAAPVLPAGLNHLRFSFSATEYGMRDLVEYRTRLDGMDDGWSAWLSESQRVLTNIKAGRHTFRVQARIRDGAISEEAVYTFRVRPPWYAGTPARLLYGMLILGAFTAVFRRQRRRFESETARIEASHREVEAERIREVEASRAAVNAMQHEKLESELHFKNQELAMTTMHLVQKAELLLTVQEGLHALQEKAVAPGVRKEIQHILNLLNFDVKLDEDWAHFAHYFDQVHVDFLKNLRERFPQLSANDYKLCAYLRMNLSTKEIAPLLNISIRGVEGSRYRLRKKLNLPNDANLTEFIMGLPPSVAPPPTDPEAPVQV